MSWNDIPRWKAMSKEQLVDEIKNDLGDDPLHDRIKWIYVDKKYELKVSVHQEPPDNFHTMLWAKKEYENKLRVWY